MGLEMHSKQWEEPFVSSVEGWVSRQKDAAWKPWSKKMLAISEEVEKKLPSYALWYFICQEGQDIEYSFCSKCNRRPYKDFRYSYIKG